MLALLILTIRQIRSDLGYNPTGPPVAHNPVSRSFHSIASQATAQVVQAPEYLIETLRLHKWHSSKAQLSVIIPGSSILEGTFGPQRVLYLLTTAMESTSGYQNPTSPQRTSTLQKETTNSLYATVHLTPLRIYVTSVTYTTYTILTTILILLYLYY